MELKDLYKKLNNLLDLQERRDLTKYEQEELNKLKKLRNKLDPDWYISDVSDSYSVIGRWTEPDGTEEWDVIHNGPLTYDEALKIAVKAGRTWDENVPSDRKNLPHREIPIKFEKLQKMIEELKNNKL